MFFEIDLDHPQRLSGAVLRSQNQALMLEFHGQGMDGKWRRLTNFTDAVLRPRLDLRLEAAAALRRAGFRYLLAPTQFDAYGKLGRKLRDEAPKWRLDPVADTGAAALFHIR